MVMKQTQTKLFGWSDVGLDFCIASRSLLFDRFKRMFVLGYNEQTVTDVAVAGNQVTLTYGGAHGYVADRVLKVESGALSLMNNGEFYIDSVTTNTVTMIIDDVPSVIAGSFKTKVAPLGWEIVYEVDTVQIYKFKNLDESDVFLRLSMPTSTSALIVYPCVGTTYDPSTGFINDPYADSLSKDVVTYTTTTEAVKWPHCSQNPASSANYTYAQGYSSYGRGMTVGSMYHMVNLGNLGSSAAQSGVIHAVFPAYLADYPQLKLPVVLGMANQGPTSPPSNLRLRCGNVDLTTTSPQGSTADRFYRQAITSFLPAEIDSFNTTMATPFYLKLQNSFQSVGMSAGGIYQCSYGSSDRPSANRNDSPRISSDIDFNHKVIVHANTTGDSLFVAIPLEVIKYGI